LVRPDISQTSLGQMDVRSLVTSSHGLELDQYVAPG
jgi:hypothetical protein